MLYLLDHPHWLAPDGQRSDVSATKPALLLCYLALQNDWVPRAQLALLLRPDADAGTASHAVRILLNRAKALPWAAALEVESTRVRFRVSLDVLEFRAAVGRADWAAALQHYKRPLLEHVHVQAEGLSEALNVECDQLELVWLEAAVALADQQSASGDYAAAASTWRACLGKNELLEEAVRGAMRAAALSGQRNAALEVFQRFAIALQRDLHALPAPATLDLLELIERSESLEPIEPLEATVPRTVTHPPRLIGRESEVARLRASRSSVTVVSGEPGVGKTRFLREYLPSDTRWLHGIDGLQGISLAPLLVAARQVPVRMLEALGAYRDDLARLLPELSQVPLESSADLIGAKARLLEGFARLLEAGGAVLAVDDLQWLDDATLECLTYTLARGKLRLYCTVRRGEITPKLAQVLGAWGAQTIRLEPLSLQSTQALVSSLIGAEQPFPVFSQWLHTSSGGNPFFALEVLKSLFETGRLHAGSGEWHSVLDHISRDYTEFKMPASVHDLVLRRVAQLPLAAQRVAEAASVIGQPFDVAMLVHLTGWERPVVIDALETLELADVLLLKGFSHDLMRQAIYKGLSESRRTALHASAAELTNLEPLRRADHALLAGQPLVAIPLLLEVGAVLNRQGLLLEARKVLQRVLDCDPDQLEALAMLAGLAMQTKEDALAHSYSQRVLSAPCDPLTRARALNVKAGLLYNAGQISQAAPVIEEAVAITAHLERTDADLEETAFDIFESEARYEDAIRILEPAVARLKRFGDSGALSTCLSSLAAIYDDTGRYAEALELHFKALETAKRAGAGYAQVGAAVQMMWGLNHAGRSHEAVEVANQALALGEYSNSEYLRNGLAASLMKLERLDEAASTYLENAERGQITTRALAWGRLATLYAGRGDLQAARQAASASLECALQTQVLFARIRAAVAVLCYGSDDQVRVILPLVQGRFSPDKDAQLEFETALLERSARAKST